MGAVSGSGVTTLLSMVAGAVAGRILQSKLSTKIDPKIVAVGQIAAGIILPKIVKNKFVAGIGTGMVVNGGVTVLNSFGVIQAVAGMAGVDDTQLEYVAGDDLSVIAGENEDYMGVTDQGIFSGTDPLSVIAGDFEDMDGGDY
jgi:hypothetical protein